MSNHENTTLGQCHISTSLSNELHTTYMFYYMLFRISGHAVSKHAVLGHAISGHTRGGDTSCRNGDSGVSYQVSCIDTHFQSEFGFTNRVG